jgi:hypothetical protein
MRNLNPLFLFAIGMALIAVTPLILLAVIPTAPAIVPACGAEPHTTNPILVPPGQTVMVGATGGGGRLTVWSNSTTSYSLYLLTQNQYNSYAANGSGINGSVHYNPPSSFYWTSGLLTSTNNTFLFGSGTWYLMVYNPGAASANVNVIAESCNAP